MDAPKNNMPFSKAQPAGRREARLGQSASHWPADPGKAARKRRAGLAALDYVLVLGVVLPLVTFIMWAGPRIIRLGYEMVSVLVAWPFM